MNLRLNESIFLTEGEIKEICVTVGNDEQLRERDIPISLSVMVNNITSGKYTQFSWS